MQKILRKIRCVGPKAVSLIQNREIPSAQSKTKMVQTRARTHAVNVRRQQLIISTNKPKKTQANKTHNVGEGRTKKIKADHVGEDLCRQHLAPDALSLRLIPFFGNCTQNIHGRTKKNAEKQNPKKKKTEKEANQYQEHLCVEWSATEPCPEGRVYLATARTSKKLHQKKIFKKPLS